jgi:hypothetical protein
VKVVPGPIRARLLPRQLERLRTIRQTERATQATEETPIRALDRNAKAERLGAKTQTGHFPSNGEWLVRPDFGAGERGRDGIAELFGLVG